MKPHQHIEVTVPAPGVTSAMFVNNEIEQFRWCVDNLLTRNAENYPGNYYHAISGPGWLRFWFNDEQSATLFALRWG